MHCAPKGASVLKALATINIWPLSGPELTSVPTDSATRLAESHSTNSTSDDSLFCVIIGTDFRPDPFVIPVSADYPKILKPFNAGAH